MKNIFKDGEQKVLHLKKKPILSDSSFDWWNSSAVTTIEASDGLIVKLHNMKPYNLDAESSLTALKKLRECFGEKPLISEFGEREYPRLFQSNLDTYKESKFTWLRRLCPVADNTADTDKLLKWIESYGLLSPAKNSPSIMHLSDVMVLASLLVTAARLLELTKTKSTLPEIEKMAIIRKPDPDHKDLYSIAFSVKTAHSEHLSEDDLTGIPEKLTVFTEVTEKLTPNIWRNIAQIWVARLATEFIEIDIAARFTKNLVVRPVLEYNGLLSWMWALILGQISDIDTSEKLKNCKVCGESYLAIRKSDLCESCWKKHKSEIVKKCREKDKKEGVINGR